METPPMPLEHTPWPFFEDQHRDLATRLHRWSSACLPACAGAGDEGQAPRTIFRHLGDDGWLGDAVATTDERGTSRLDLRRACLLREILAYNSVTADVAFSEPWLGALPLALFGSREQWGAYHPGFIAGRFLPAFALSEPGAGSDAAALTTRATPCTGGFVLNGCKTWISNAGLADRYVVFARTGEGAKGITAFLVPGSASGLRLRERIPVATPHALGTLELADCFVDSGAVLGGVGEGFPIAMAVLEVFRPTVAAAAVGIARRAMDEAIAWSKERVTFGCPLAQHQLVQEKLATMATQIDAAALLTYRAAWEYDRGTPRIARQAASAKLHATETAQQVVDQAQQLFGGRGVVAGSVLERLYRQVRAYRIFDGASEIQQLIIAREVLR